MALRSRDVQGHRVSRIYSILYALFNISTRGQHHAWLDVPPLSHAPFSFQACFTLAVMKNAFSSFSYLNALSFHFKNFSQPFSSRTVVHFEVSLEMSPSGALSEPLTSIPAKASDFIKPTAKAQQLSVS